MAIGFPSIRVDHTNPLHHLWCNNGTWWIHYTLHFAGRKRRIRRSLGTPAIDVALHRRDELLTRLAHEGEPVPERRPCRMANHTLAFPSLVAGAFSAT
ncbi:MAG: hypothetical protein WD060_10335 [Pirellulales bacterium]